VYFALKVRIIRTTNDCLNSVNWAIEDIFKALNANPTNRSCLHRVRCRERNKQSIGIMTALGCETAEISFLAAQFEPIDSSNAFPVQGFGRQSSCKPY
jgi:hypothetical protein